MTEFNFGQTLGEVLNTLWTEREVRPALSTFLPELDELLCGGIGYGELLTFGARTSQGKTAFGMGIALSHAIEGTPVVVFSTEMSKRDLACRCIQTYTGFAAKDIEKKRLSEEDLAGIQEVINTDLKNLPLILRYDSNLTGQSFAQALQQYKEKMGVKLVVIDYIQNMEGSVDNKTYSIAKNIKQIKQAIVETDVACILLAQIGRGIYGKSPNNKVARRRPLLSDLSDSASIEQASDTVLMAHYEEDPPWIGQVQCEIGVQKQRNGGSGVVNVLFDPPYATFRSLI